MSVPIFAVSGSLFWNRDVFMRLNTVKSFVVKDQTSAFFKKQVNIADTRIIQLAWPLYVSYCCPLPPVYVRENTVRKSEVPIKNM